MTQEQHDRMDKCREALGPCVEDRSDLLADFLNRLGLPEPWLVRSDASRFVPDVSEWLDAQSISEDDIGFLLLRIALLVGESLAQQFGGEWILDDDPYSPSFATYIVGRFSRAPAQGRSVAPFLAARDYLAKLRRRGPVAVPVHGATLYVSGEGHTCPTLIAVAADLRAHITRH